MSNPRLRLIQMVLGTVLVFPSDGTALLAQDSSQSSPPMVYELYAKGVTPPKAVYQPNPECAESARKKKIHGEVLLSMIVTAEGTVRDATVTQSLDNDLDKKALEAVSNGSSKPPPKMESRSPSASPPAFNSICIRSVAALIIFFLRPPRHPPCEKFSSSLF